jgi:hypothetical protein
LPVASCGFIEFAHAGGFVGYGFDCLDMWRYAATLTKPANPPVDGVTKFIGIDNLKTAKALGLGVLPS